MKNKQNIIKLFVDVWSDVPEMQDQLGIDQGAWIETEIAKQYDMWVEGDHVSPVLAHDMYYYYMGERMEQNSAIVDKIMNAQKELDRLLGQDIEERKKWEEEEKKLEEAKEEKPKKEKKEKK